MNWQLRNHEQQISTAEKLYVVVLLRVVVLLVTAIGLWMNPAMSLAKIAQEPGANTDKNGPSEASANQNPAASSVPTLYQQAGTENEIERLEQRVRLLKERSLSESNSPDSQSLEFDPQGVNVRVRTIHERIEQLKKIMDRQRASAEANGRRAGQIKAKDISAAIPNSAAAADPKPAESNSVEPPAAALPKILTIKPPTIEQDTKLPPSTNPLPDGIQMIASPVNSFELANSLFATGSYRQALKSYESLLQEDVSEHERNWLSCLAASCYRIQGDIANAESLYRDVLSTREQSFSTDYSKWFLDHLTNKKQLQEEIRMLTGELETLAPGDSQ